MISSLLYDIVVFSLQTTCSLLTFALATTQFSRQHPLSPNHLGPGSFRKDFRIPLQGSTWSGIVSATIPAQGEVSQLLYLQCSTAETLECESIRLSSSCVYACTKPIWTAFSFISRLAIGTNRGFALVDSATNRCLYILSNIASILCTCSPHNVLYIAWKFCKVGQELISGCRGNYFLSTYHGYSLYM